MPWSAGGGPLEFDVSGIRDNEVAWIKKHFYRELGVQKEIPINDSIRYMILGNCHIRVISGVVLKRILYGENIHVDYVAICPKTSDRYFVFGITDEYSNLTAVRSFKTKEEAMIFAKEWEVAVYMRYAINRYRPINL